jgi:hypothetical protein
VPRESTGLHGRVSIGFPDGVEQKQISAPITLPMSSGRYNHLNHETLKASTLVSHVFDKDGIDHFQEITVAFTFL